MTRTALGPPGAPGGVMGHEAKRTRGGGDVALDTKRERLVGDPPPSMHRRR